MPQERSTKSAWLEGGDLKTRVLEDVPVKGKSVKIQELPARYVNEAHSRALQLVTERGVQQVKVDTAELEIFQFAYGVVEPEFTVAEARIVSMKYRSAFQRVVSAIVELSEIDPDDYEEADARFPGGGEGSVGEG